MTTSPKTAVVIGGGMAGLAAAAALSRLGLSVQLFEARGKLGGAAANTVMKGFTFHDGAIFLPSPQLLKRTFQELGICSTNAEFDKLLPLRRVTRDAATHLPSGAVVEHLDGTKWNITDPKRDIDLAEVNTEVERWTQRWNPVCKIVEEKFIFGQPPSLFATLGMFWRHLAQMSAGAEKELKRFFSDVALRSAMAGSILFSGCTAKQVNAMSLLPLVMFMKDGLWLPQGGMGRVPQTLESEAKKRGCQLFLNSRAKRIVVQDGRATAVEIEGIGKIAADVVVSTISAFDTVNKLLSAEDVPRSLRRTAKRLKPSRTAFSLQLGLKNTIRPSCYQTHVIPEMEGQSSYFSLRDFGEAHRATPWLAWSVPTMVVPSLAPQGGSIVEMFPPIPQGVPVAEWTQERKDEVVARALAILSKHHKLDIAVIRARSPLDLQNEMNLSDGAIYGLKQPAVEFFPHRSSLPRLYLAGQTTFPGMGIYIAAISGLDAARAAARDLGVS